MHGELNSILCEHCGKRYPYFEDSTPKSECKHCHHQSLRPDIVWFGEMPYQMERIEKLLYRCDLSITAPKTSAFRPVIKARKLSVTQEYFDFQYTV